MQIEVIIPGTLKIYNQGKELHYLMNVTNTKHNSYSKHLKRATGNQSTDIRRYHSGNNSECENDSKNYILFLNFTIIHWLNKEY